MAIYTRIPDISSRYWLQWKNKALKFCQEGNNEHHKSPSVERGKWFREQDSICEAFFMMYKENGKLASQEKFRRTLLRKLGLSFSKICVVNGLL